VGLLRGVRRMDVIMRTGLLNGVMCLIGLNGPAACMGQETWKNRKHVHLTNTISRGFDVSTSEDLAYFGSQLSDERDFRSQLDTILIPRPVGSANHAKVRRHIAETMKNLGWDVGIPKTSDRTPHGDKDFYNVIATLDPEAPRRMVIACHYDSLLKPEGFLGATDSAVPCAQMLNMARTMSQELNHMKSQKPELTLQFIFFDGEEAFVRWTSTDSIYGSRALARDWEGKGYNYQQVQGNHLDRIDIFVLLDLIGAGDMSFMKLESSTGDWYDRLVGIERRLRGRGLVGGSTIFKDAQRIPSGIEDDHIPFKRRGVPILHLISVPFPKAWHKMGDNRSSLDFRRIGDLNKILRVFTAEYLNINP